MQPRYKFFLCAGVILFAIVVSYNGAGTSTKLPTIVGDTFHKILGELLNSEDLGELSKEFRELYKPIVLPITAPSFENNGTTYSNDQTYWKESLGKDLCIADIDTRDFSHDGQILSENFSWSTTDRLSAGMLNHYLYASIHGYSYHFVRPETWPDESRSNVWTKIPKLRKLLDVCRVVLMVDSDVVVQHPEIPFEWLMNRWHITPDTSMSLPWDVHQYVNDTNGELIVEFLGSHDTHGMLMMNAGVVIAQSTPRAKEMVDAWISCPDDTTRFPGCEEYRSVWPAEQGAFNQYIRHEFPEGATQSIACDDANGYPGQHTNCSGIFLRHFTGAKDDVKGNVGDVLLEDLSYIFAKQFHRAVLGVDSER